MFIKLPKILRLMMPRIIWERHAPGRVFLTFDDGPTPRITEFILDTLDQYGAKATFFCLGKNAELYPELLSMIRERGHRIGNHTSNHLKGWKVSTSAYWKDIQEADSLLRTDLFRPPYGRIGLKQIWRISRHYRTVMWTVISQDYSKKISPQECLEKVTRHIRPGYIIVFHDSVKAFGNMSYALPRVLEQIRDKGYVCDIIE